MAQVTPREGAEILDELGNMSPSASSLERLPKQLSRRWEEHRAAFEESLRADLLVPDEATIMAVSLDGVMAPMKDGKRQAKRAAARAEGRRTKGPAGYREAGCGTVSFYDCEGERLGTLRMGRMPETKKATLKGMLSAEVEAALEHVARQLVPRQALLTTIPTAACGAAASITDRGPATAPHAAGVGQFPSGALPAVPHRHGLLDRLGRTHPTAAAPPQAGILPVRRGTRAHRDPARPRHAHRWSLDTPPAEHRIGPQALHSDSQHPLNPGSFTDHGPATA